MIKHKENFQNLIAGCSCRHLLIISWIAIMAITLFACSPAPNNALDPDHENEQPDTGTEEVTPDRFDRPPTRIPSTQMPERVPPTEEIPQGNGEVPGELMDKILDDLEEHLGEKLDNYSVIRAQAIVWNDGSLGCPKPGEIYTQATVNGYWIIIEVGAQEFDYRATETGYFFLCEGGIQPIAPPSTPES